MPRITAMSGPLRMAEAVCAGHPDRLADSIADAVVALACERDRAASVGIEVAVNRSVVFVDGRVAAGEGDVCVVSEEEIAAVARDVFRNAGYGPTPGTTPADAGFGPDPGELDVRFDLSLVRLGEEERALRDMSDDQAVGVGYAVDRPRAGYRPIEQALASDFCRAIERLRVSRSDLGLGPDGKSLVITRGSTLVGVSLSVHHRVGAEWLALSRAVRAACEQVAAEYVAAGELNPPAAVDWLVNGAGAFEVGGPLGDNGLSGKKLVAEAYGTAVPIGGGTVHGKDPRRVDVRAQRLARQMALELVTSGRAHEATVWVAFRPGDVEPHWVEVVTTGLQRAA